MWPIRCGAWVASKSLVVVRSECNPRSTTTLARPRSFPYPRPSSSTLPTRSFPPSATNGSSSRQSSISFLAHSGTADSLATPTAIPLFPLGSCLFAAPLRAMLDDPKPLSARPGPKRPTRRFFVITNPNEEPVDPSTPPFYPPPPLPSTSRQHPDKPTPSPPQPSPINTDNLQQKYPQRYNPSDRTLSSPSTSTSSPAHESTPPPSTPGQIELAQGSDRDNCQNHLISRTDNFVKKITAPFSHVRRKSSGTNVPPMAGSVRAVCFFFYFLCDPPNVCVFSPPSITIRPLLPKHRNRTRA